MPLLLSILAGFPDRIARRRRPSAPDDAELLLASGGSARLAETSVVRDAPFLVAVDAEERTRAGRSEVVVRVASAVEPEWLLDLFPERMRESREVLWNATASRAEAVSRLLYDELVVEESRGPADAAEAARVLAEQALAKGVASFASQEAIDRFFARVAFARGLSGEALPQLGEADLCEAVVAACEGRKSLAELQEAPILEALRTRLTGKQLALLDRLAPDRLRLPGGRQTAVQYAPDKPPWIESRLQDFFGMATGPSVGDGRVPLVLHLLAPNGRDVQVTTDLAGFWDRHYPAIRRELCRRYPKHSWPEDPRTARPPAPRR